MALSNIFNEPMREITETVVGLLFVGSAIAVPMIGGYFFATEMTYRFPEESFAFNMACGFALTALLMAITFVLAKFVHFVGEVVCDALDDRGVHLRPRREQRPISTSFTFRYTGTNLTTERAWQLHEAAQQQLASLRNTGGA